MMIKYCFSKCTPSVSPWFQGEYLLTGFSDNLQSISNPKSDRPPLHKGGYEGDTIPSLIFNSTN